MSLLTGLISFTNGTGPANIIDATQMNSNFTAVATAVNNIYPSQILPITSGQATFGATATGVGYKFLANDATATPLTVSGVTSQSVDIQQWTPTSGGSVTTAIDKNGALYFPNAATVSGTEYSLFQTTNVLGFNIPTGKSFGFYTNGVQEAGITKEGIFFAPANGLPGGSSGAFFQAGTANASVKALDFGNSVGAGHFSRIGSLGDTINTIVGTVFELADSSVGALLTVDATGALGVLAAVHQTSRRAMKKDIAPLTFSPLEVILETDWQQYRLKSESDTKQPHVGFMAEDTSPWLAGATQDHMVPSDMAAIAAASVKELTLKLRAAGIAI